MSRVALYDALVGDPILNGYGLNQDTIYSNFSSEERPADALFMILRWGDQDRPRWQKVKAPERLTVWVHYPRDTGSNDFGRLIKVLDRIDEILGELRDTVGSDEYRLAFVEIDGRSRDLIDDGFNTITKTGDYQVHSQRI